MFILGILISVILFFLWCCLRVSSKADEKMFSQEYDKKNKK